jgi:thiol-disulfide isomerase/thioredoxin
MSSCKLKNNIERYANPPRTPYDQLFNKMYDPNQVNFHAAPWPMQRTSFDMELQKEWCTCPLCFSQRSGPEIDIIVPVLEGYKEMNKPKLPLYMNSFNMPNIQHNMHNMSGKKGTFILCFAEWCGYCKKYMSMWNKFKEQNANEYDFVEANMSDSNNIVAPENVKPFLRNIQGFPTILCVLGLNGSSEKTIHMIEKRDNIIQEIKSKFGNNTVCVL